MTLEKVHTEGKEQLNTEEYIEDLYLLHLHDIVESSLKHTHTQT